MERFGWCFIGCGSLAGRVSRQIEGCGRHKIISVYARDEQRRAAFAADHGAFAARTAAEAMTAPGVEGVYVVTPHPAHAGYVQMALELGKPVLCEKPFTVNAAQAEDLFRLARERGIYAAEAMWTWFAPAANQVKAWLDRGEFGQIERAEGFYRVYAENCPSRLFEPEQAGGALLDIGVYPLTYLYRLFGMPEAVRCTGCVEKGIDWEEEIVLTYPSGGVFRASVSIRDREKRELFSLAGTKAWTDIPAFYGTDRAELVRADGTREAVKGDGSYVREFDAVAEEIRRGRTESRFVPQRATLDVLALMDECRRQLGLSYPCE